LYEVYLCKITTAQARDAVEKYIKKRRDFMKRKTYQEMSKQIVELVGNKENISLFTHCVTRLRFNVRDKS